MPRGCLQTTRWKSFSLQDLQNGRDFVSNIDLLISGDWNGQLKFDVGSAARFLAMREKKSEEEG